VQPRQRQRELEGEGLVDHLVDEDDADCRSHVPADVVKIGSYINTRLSYMLLVGAMKCSIVDYSLMRYSFG
jgi:hypothetical protein